MLCENTTLNAFIFSGFLGDLSNFIGTTRTPIHLQKEGNVCLEAQGYYSLSVGVLGEVLPICRDGTGLPWQEGLKASGILA